MIHNIAMTFFLGKPLVMYGGLFAFLLMIITAIIGLVKFRENKLANFKWHSRSATLAIVITLFHVIFGLSIFFNF